MPLTSGTPPNTPSYIPQGGDACGTANYLINQPC
jgi:hypothetical protein